MELIDTHTHLYLSDFSNDIEEVMARAANEHVERFYLPAIDSAHTNDMQALQRKYPDRVFLMAGLHPCSVRENFREELYKIELQLSGKKIAAIGETGLDFYWDTTFSKEQYVALEQQAAWAVQYRLPLVLHTRNAMKETINAIAGYTQPDLKGIFHCFSGDIPDAEKIIECGFFLGIGGVVTFKNSGLDRVVKEIPLQHIVLETDAPYLAPAPFRGKRNESSYLKYIVEKIASVKEMDVEQVASITTANAKILFDGS